MYSLEKTRLNAIELAHSKLVQPNKLVEYFNTATEFKEWTETGTPSDLRACLIAFERAELFDHCAIIKNTLNQKENV